MTTGHPRTSQVSWCHSSYSAHTWCKPEKKRHINDIVTTMVETRKHSFKEWKVCESDAVTGAKRFPRRWLCEVASM